MTFLTLFNSSFLCFIIVMYYNINENNKEKKKYFIKWRQKM